MLKTAEFVSLGHPDKTADYISSYILDCLIKQDACVRYAVEVMIKDNTVILGGEVCGKTNLTDIDNMVKEALRQIGYNEQYALIWGDNAINIKKIKVINLIGYQSREISQGVTAGGWGDQGVFAGYACKGKGFLPKELYLTKKLNNKLYNIALKDSNLGLDIKTQITIDDNGNIQTVIVAIPMLNEVDLSETIISILQDKPKQLIINGTGTYKCHSSVADCGVTGRKLACDFYSLSCPVGGGSPWAKDATKADVSLNIMARKLAVENLQDNDEAFVYLSSCIGKEKLPSAVVKTVKNGVSTQKSLDGDFSPQNVISSLGLDKPVFAELCRNGIVNID
ncbi:MAG: methionine adenosyltransferase domain-containing protein [Alphaproteobacteria bacterium]|nr:methionine adenosyltransferase domain-containing protein [Alphaproteobacteria bacterium]